MTKETSKCYDIRKSRGYFDTYLIGSGIDIGGGDDCLKVPNGNVIRYDKEQGNAQTMNNVLDNSYDFVYSSHCLEHMENPLLAIKHWIRICKPGGYIYVVVPDEYYYEQGFWPSKWNGDHKWSFTLNDKTKQPKNIVITEMLNQLNNIEIIDKFTNLQNYNYDLQRGIDQTFKFENMVCCQHEFILRKE